MWLNAPFLNQNRARSTDPKPNQIWQPLLGRIWLTSGKPLPAHSRVSRHSAVFGPIPLATWEANRRLVFLCSCISQRRAHDAYVIRLDSFRVRQSAEVRKDAFITFEILICILQNAWIRYRRPLFTPRSRARDVLLWMRKLYFMSSELLTRNTRLPPL